MTDELATVDTVANPSYADAYCVPIGQRESRSPEQWMRAVFEGAPARLRGFVGIGWRFVLGFRPGPRHSTEHILGWAIATQDAESITLRQSSTLMRANLVLRVAGDPLVLASFTRHEHPAAGPIWFVVGAVHRRVVPYALGHAATSTSEQAS